MKTQSRWVAWAGVVATMAAAVVTVQIIGSTPAAAVPGLHRVFAEALPHDSRPVKQAIARCGPGEQVVGGGAIIDDFFGFQVVLTELRPFDGGGQPDGYVATAQEPAAGFTGGWQFGAIALCASPVAGHVIVSDTTDLNSSTFKANAAVCPAGKLVTGTGSRIDNAGGQVGLHLNRSSGPRDISRSSARERANGYSGDWSLTSYAICANPIAGMTEEGELAPGGAANFRCPSGRVHSVGGGGGLVDSGPFFLKGLFMNADLTIVTVAMTGAPAGGTVVQAICGP